MTEDQRREFDRYRREHPFASLTSAYDWATRSTATGWTTNQDLFPHFEAVKEHEGFTIRLRATMESTAPKPDRNNHTDYGTYDSGRENNYGERVLSDTPLGLPSRHFRYATATRDTWEFFVPDDLEERFEMFRAAGQSKSVARDLTIEWLAKWLPELMSLEYWDIEITAERGGVELGRYSTQVDFIDPEAADFIASAEDWGIDEALAEARGHLDELAVEVVYVVRPEDILEDVVVFERAEDAEHYRALRDIDRDLERATICDPELAQKMFRDALTNTELAATIRRIADGKGEAWQDIQPFLDEAIARGVKPTVRIREVAVSLATGATSDEGSEEVPKHPYDYASALDEMGDD